MKKPTKKLMIFAMFTHLAFIAHAFGASFPLTLIDDDGEKVTITKEPQKIAIAGIWPLPSVMIMLDNSAKRIAYMPQASKNALLHSFMIDFYPQIAQIPTGNSENIEELLNYKPDVFICHSANKAICALMRKSGVPTLAISVAKWGYNSHKTLEGWFRLVAPLLDKESKAERILQEIKKQEGLAKQQLRAQNLSLQKLQNPQNPQNQQNPSAKNTQNSSANKPHSTLESNALPKAIFIHTYASDEKLVIAGIFGKYLLDFSGGIHALDSLRSATTSIEEIYKLNPDIIYINNFTPLLPKQILESKRWQGIKAVQHKRVYKLPLGSYRPFAPGVDLPLLLAWLGAHNEGFIESSKAHLDSAKSVIKEDYKAYAKWYYKEIFGLDLDETQIDKIFNPSSKAGILQ
ncbi:ABC transporter substrate-binding protein [Helicobacter sp. T3_23-1056]